VDAMKKTTQFIIDAIKDEPEEDGNFFAGLGNAVLCTVILVAFVIFVILMIGGKP
jgi:hypothetical protein